MRTTITPTPRAGTRPPTRWGRSSRIGGGTRRLIGLSLAGGAVLTAVLGLASWGLAQAGSTPDPQHAGIVALLVAAFSFPTMTVLTWALLVDRESVRGAVRNTEDSVEGQWYTAATSGSFHDLLVLLGVGGLVVTLAGWQLQTSLVVLGLLLFLAASAGIRYAFQKRRG